MEAKIDEIHSSSHTVNLWWSKKTNSVLLLSRLVLKLGYHTTFYVPSLTVVDNRLKYLLIYYQVLGYSQKNSISLRMLWISEPSPSSARNFCHIDRHKTIFLDIAVFVLISQVPRKHSPIHDIMTLLSFCYVLSTRITPLKRFHFCTLQ